MAKLATRKPVKKTAAKKTVVNETPVKNPGIPRGPKDEHGFVQGTDTSLIAEVLLAGGASRKEMAEKIFDVIEPNTRNGTPKNGSILVSGVLKRLLDKGYEIEETWRVVPPSSNGEVKTTKKRVGKINKSKSGAKGSRSR